MREGNFKLQAINRLTAKLKDEAARPDNKKKQEDMITFIVIGVVSVILAEVETDDFFIPPFFASDGSAKCYGWRYSLL